MVMEYALDHFITGPPICRAVFHINRRDVCRPGRILATDAKGVDHVVRVHVGHITGQTMAHFIRYRNGSVSDLADPSIFRTRG